MARYPLGQPIYLSTTIKDRTGTLVNPGALSLTTTKPDLTTQTYSSPTNDGVGLYHQDIPATDLTIIGHYQYVWTSTGAGAGVAFGDFDVFDPLEPAVLPLQDAKDVVNIPQTTTSYDGELQAYVNVVTAMLEEITGGPAYNRTIVERVTITHNFEDLVVRQRPLQSITSIVDIASGATVPIPDLELDQNAGIARRKRHLSWWFWGNSGYLITYVAGWGTAVPPALNIAARIIFQNLWETQRGPGQAPVPGMEGQLGVSGYTIPPRALAILHGKDPTMGMGYAQEVYL